MELSSRALQMEPSATLNMVAMAKALKKEGKNVISFGAGEPDFTSPPSALKAAHQAIDDGKTHYTPAVGIPELREAIKDYYKGRFNLKYHIHEIVVGTGAKPCLFEALACVLNPGEEAMILAPAWVSYVEQIHFLGSTPVVINTQEKGFRPDMAALEEKITSRTKVLVLNSPCNPTGVIYSKETLQELAHFAQRHNLWIIWDEIYERLTYGEHTHTHLLNIAPELQEQTLVINGVSKAYAMTGWRIGYALGPRKLMEKIASLQGHLTSNPCSIAQWAALEAITRGEKDVATMKDAFEKRRNRTVEILSQIQDISFPVPQGAFYVMVNIQKHLQKTYNSNVLHDDTSFCMGFLQDQYVATVPGSAFLAPGYLRLSYANALEEIEEGLARFQEFLHKLN